MSSSSDLELRKQLLLTRIALERTQWAQEARALQVRLEPQRILPGLLRSVFGQGWLSGLFSAPGHRMQGASLPGVADRVSQAITLMRRYPVLLSLLGSALPWAKARRGLGRIALWSIVGAGAAGLTWLLASRRSTPPQTPFE